MAFLIGQNGFKIEIPTDGKRRKLGRADDCDIVISDPAVSRQHLFLTSNNMGELFVENAGSPAGFYINGSQVQGASYVKIGERIAIGSQEYIFSDKPTASIQSSFNRASNSAQSISFSESPMSKKPRDIGPVKMLFAIFTALVILSYFIRQSEESDKSKLDTIDPAPQPALPSDGYKGSAATTKSQTEIQADLKHRESLRDYYNKNYSRAIIGFKEALVLNPAQQDAADFLQLAESELKTQIQDLLKDGQRSFSNLQFRRSKGQALRVLNILGEQIPSYSRKVVQDVITGRQVASTTQEDLLNNLPCEKSREQEICKQAKQLLVDSRKALKEEEALK